MQQRNKAWEKPKELEISIIEQKRNQPWTMQQ
jgi:hypothetical protein